MEVARSLRSLVSKNLFLLNPTLAKLSLQRLGITNAEVSLMKKLLRSKLVDSKHDVEVQRSDPKSPLYSVKSFGELNL